MNAMALESGRRTGGGLSPRSVCLMHRVLAQAMKQAVKWQLLAQNPCDAVSPPRVERKQMKVLDADGTAAIIEEARPKALFMPILLGVLCGLRRGELAALRWRNIDLEAAQISIVASLEQTNNGVRLNHQNRAALAPLRSRRSLSRNYAGIGCSSRQKNCYGSAFG